MGKDNTKENNPIYQELKDTFQWLTTVNVFASTALPSLFIVRNPELLSKYTSFFALALFFSVVSWIGIVYNYKKWTQKENSVLEFIERLALRSLCLMAIVFFVSVAAPVLLEKGIPLKVLVIGIFLLTAASIATTMGFTGVVVILWLKFCRLRILTLQKPQRRALQDEERTVKRWLQKEWPKLIVIFSFLAVGYIVMPLIYQYWYGSK